MHLSKECSFVVCVCAFADTGYFTPPTDRKSVVV